jgi:hypothetical protein
MGGVRDRGSGKVDSVNLVWRYAPTNNETEEHITWTHPPPTLCSWLKQLAPM